MNGFSRYILLPRYNYPLQGNLAAMKNRKMELCDDVSDQSISSGFDNDTINDEEDVSDLQGNPKLADALSKVLCMAKAKKKNKSIVLSKAKLYRPNQHVEKENKYDFKIVPCPNAEIADVKEKEEDIKPDLNEDKKAIKKIGLSRYEKLKRGRIIPSVSDREKERQLTRIATKGVVQLFNAVKQQQSSLEKQFKESKLTETKREKILKSIDKKTFFSALSGSIHYSIDEEEKKIEKVEVKDEEEFKEENIQKPSWEILRNDFMMGAKLKDWDKKGEESDDETDEN